MGPEIVAPTSTTIVLYDNDPFTLPPLNTFNSTTSPLPVNSPYISSELQLRLPSILPLGPIFTVVP